ncbi:hypothetical protein CD934_23810 [Streptomyces calvus]|uniref:Uncharacterized protein n=1 Tax=Streptomyces calvus TaxID=67282 RepID=A0A514JVE7_9ACTN|nr:hypothetical protein CD934_23810 [Streptomyces calvus]
MEHFLEARAPPITRGGGCRKGQTAPLLEPHRGYRPVREYLARFDDARRAGMLLPADPIPPSPGAPPHEAHSTRSR